MKIRRSAHLSLLRCASWIVPAGQREEWLAEWRAELWHVWQSHESQPSTTSGDNTIDFCLGAFNDALWLHRNNSHPKPQLRFRLDSSQRCVSFLAVLTIIAVTVALFVPGARRAIRRSPYRDGNRLVLISHDGSSVSAIPSISHEDYLEWRERNQDIFSDFAFYQPAQSRVRAFGHPVAALSSAVASNNLFELLGIPVPLDAFHDPANRHLPMLVLSRTAWQRYFNQDSRIAGSVVDVDGRQAIVASVIADDAWQLPGHMDAWLLESADALTRLPQSSAGYVVGRATQQTSDRWHMLVRQPGGGYIGFTCSSLGERSRQPVTFFLFALMLACLALPATTPLPLGDYPVSSERFFGTTRRRRWVLLSVKMALILPIVYCGALDLAYANPSMNPATSMYIQIFASFAGLLFFFRWSLRDQRRRCPVCLHVLTSPARVGHPSRNFLAWSGTELICGKGHGLLHVPEISTSWFSTQRWLSLDPSWHGLFREAYLPSPGVF